MEIRKLFEKVQKDGIITQEEIQMINEAMLKDGVFDYEEKNLLQTMSDKIRSGELKEVR